MLEIRLAEATGEDDDRRSNAIFFRKKASDPASGLQALEAQAAVRRCSDLTSLTTDEAFEAFLLEILVRLSGDDPELAQSRRKSRRSSSITPNRTREIHDA